MSLALFAAVAYSGEIVIGQTSDFQGFLYGCPSTPGKPKSGVTLVEGKITFAAFSYFKPGGQELTPAIAFTSLSLFGVLRMPICLNGGTELLIG